MFVLLGAGASVESGIPTAIGMTERFLRLSKEPLLQNRLPFANVLGMIVGELTKKRWNHLEWLDRGTDSCQKINIEEVFNAIEPLSSRNSMDGASFVKTWSEEANSYSETDLRATLSWMIGSLWKMTRVADFPQIAHYRPFVKWAHTNSICVATLNYDNAVELACEAEGIVAKHNGSLLAPVISTALRKGRTAAYQIARVIQLVHKPARPKLVASQHIRGKTMTCLRRSYWATKCGLRCYLEEGTS